MKFLGDVGGIIVVKDDIPDENLEILKMIHPNSRIVKEKDKKDIFTDVIIRVSEELTPEEEGVFKSLYPNCKIIVEGVR